jgi:hypothetical protein
MINKTIGSAIETIAAIPIKIIEKIETCILFPPSSLYDVCSPISALRSKDQGLQNAAEVCRGNEAKRNDIGKP